MTMKFKVQPASASVNDNPDIHLPLSHTCFFQLGIPSPPVRRFLLTPPLSALPYYSSKEILRAKLVYAMTHCRAMDSDFRLHHSDIVARSQ